MTDKEIKFVIHYSGENKDSFILTKKLERKPMKNAQKEVGIPIICWSEEL